MTGRPRYTDVRAVYIASGLKFSSNPESDGRATEPDDTVWNRGMSAWTSLNDERAMDIWWPADASLYKLLTDWGGFLGAIIALIAAIFAFVAIRLQTQE